MKLLAIRTELESAIKNALPGWNIYSARVEPVPDNELPCVNLFFHSDELLEEQGRSELRQVQFEIEAGLSVPSGDSEKELFEIRERIEPAVILDAGIQREVVKIMFTKVDFGHKAKGQIRIGVLLISAEIIYQKVLPRPKPPVLGSNMRPIINGVEQPDG